MDRSTKMQHKRIAKGLCPKCGKENKSGKYYCDECRAKIYKSRKENREFYRELGFCPECKKNRLFGDEKFCIECSVKHTALRDRNRKPSSNERKQYLSIKNKSRYQERIEKGLCTKCGERKAIIGKKKCGICQDKENAYKRNRYIPKIVGEGKCAYCNEFALEGKKVCQKHYDMNLEKCKKMKILRNLRREGVNV